MLHKVVAAKGYRGELLRSVLVELKHSCVDIMQFYSRNMHAKLFDLGLKTQHLRKKYLQQPYN